MIASSACPLVVTIDGYFFKTTSNGGGDPALSSVILHHIPLSNGGPQPMRCVSAILLLELIAAGEAVLVAGDLTDSHDSKDLGHLTIKGPVSVPCRRGEEPSLKTAPLVRNPPGLRSFSQQRQRSAA
jgi:hypothetical protein